MEARRNTRQSLRISQHLFVQRRRLIDRLDSENQRRLVLILGQAAQGKTTLAAVFTRQSRIPTAWLNLRAFHSDAQILYSSMLETIARLRKRARKGDLGLLPTSELSPREHLSLYREWVQAAFKTAPIPIRIVMDGLDHFPPESTAFEFLQVLLDDAPDGVTFLMLSRTSPHLEIERMRLNQQAAVIENRELAFTLRETQAFFSKHGISLSKDLLQEIQQATEGWVGGLKLVSEALMGLQAEEKKDFIHKSLPREFKMRSFKYLGEQIFDRQPDGVRDLLIKASLLDVVDPSFLNEFLDRGDAESILGQLIERNLFVCPVHDDTETVKLRFHRVFRDFLLSRFHALHPPDAERYWLRRAAGIYEYRGDLKNAINYSIKAGDHAGAARLIESVGLKLLQSNRIGDLSRWLHCLPPEHMDDNPWLLLFLTLSRRYSHAAANILCLQRALSLFEERGDLRGQMLALAHLIEASIMCDGSAFPVAQLVSAGEALLRSMAADDYPYERAVLRLQLGFAQRIRIGNPGKGFASCQTAYLIGKQLRDERLQFHALCHALEALTLLGESALAEEIREKAERLKRKHQCPEMESIFLLHTSLLTLFRGEAERACSLIQKARDTAEENGLIYLYPVTRMYSLLIGVHLRRHEEVDSLGAQLLETCSAMGQLFINGVVSFILGLNAYWRGDYGPAREWAARSELLMSSTRCGSPYHLNAIRVLTGMLQYHVDDETRGKGELCRSVTYFDEIRCHHLRCEARVAMGLNQWKVGDHDEARRCLNEAIEMWRANECRCFLIIKPEDAARACAVALDLELETAEEWTPPFSKAQMSRCFDSELDSGLKHSGGSVGQKVRRLKAAIHRSKKPGIRIRTLGHFQVFAGETELSMESRHWGGAVPKNLLKCMLALGPRKIPWERLAEELWPGIDRVHGERRLKINLHRLRKTLEPDLDPAFGSSYVSFEERRISLDREFCHVDLEEFLSLIEKGRKAEMAGSTREAAALYQQTIQIYDGPFLPEDLYTRSVSERRMELQNRYLEVLHRLSCLFEQEGRLKSAADLLKKVLQVDPLDDQACRRVMTLFSAMGLRNQALRTFEGYRERLAAEMAAEPDDTMSAIYNKILEEA